MAGPSRLEREQAGFPIAAVYPIPDPTGTTALGAAAAPRPRGAPQPRLTPLSPVERAAVVDGLVAVLDGLYAHLPLKRARYATDPLQRLRLLRQQSPDLDDLEFHHQLASILTGLRDGHTRYIGPAALRDWAAHLGFLVESWGPAEAPRYVVSKLTRHLIEDQDFAQGVELLWWNGVPIDRAVDLHADRETGGRPDSRRARALESLTLRALRFSPPPDERWVDIGYQDLNGLARETRVHWRIVKPGRSAAAAATPGPAAAFRAAPAPRARAIDPAAETTRRVKMLLFAEQSRASAGTALRRQIKLTIRQTTAGDVAVLRLWSFDVLDDGPYVAEVIRLLRKVPADARGCGRRPAGQPRRAGVGVRAAAPAVQPPPHPAHPLRHAGHAAHPRHGALAPERAPAGALAEQPGRRGVDGRCLFGGPAAHHGGRLQRHRPDLWRPGRGGGGRQDLFGGRPVRRRLRRQRRGAAGVGGRGQRRGRAEVWTDPTVRDALLGTRFEQAELPGARGSRSRCAGPCAPATRWTRPARASRTSASATPPGPRHDPAGPRRQPGPVRGVRPDPRPRAAHCARRQGRRRGGARSPPRASTAWTWWWTTGRGPASTSPPGRRSTWRSRPAGAGPSSWATRARCSASAGCCRRPELRQAFQSRSS
jgi:hypothetical protein